MKLVEGGEFSFSFRPSALLILLLPLIVLNLLDIFTTRYALGHCSACLYEMNSLYYLPFFEIGKIIVVFFLYCFYCVVWSVTPHVAVRDACVYSYAALLVFSAFVVVNNVYWIISVS